jgi:hypothetical protein
MHPSDYSDMRAVSEQPCRLRGTRDASAYLRERYGVLRAPSTLAKLRVIGGGPEFRRIGDRAVGYTDPALDAYAEALISKPLRSTSEAA